MSETISWSLLLFSPTRCTVLLIFKRTLYVVGSQEVWAETTRDSLTVETCSRPNYEASTFRLLVNIDRWCLLPGEDPRSLGRAIVNRCGGQEGLGSEYRR